MRNSAKFAVSLPWKEFQELERIREKAQLSRSAFILRAFQSWKETQKKAELIKIYEEGYRKMPEDASFAEALAGTARDALRDEEWE